MATRAKVIPLATAAAAAALLLWIWTRFADLWLPSLGFWTGFTLVLAGILSLAIPLKFVAIPSRRAGLKVAGGGLLLCAVSLLWPATDSSGHGAGQTGLDRALPIYDHREIHQIRVRGSLSEVSQAARNVNFSDIRGLKALMSIRNGKRVDAPAVPMLKAMTGPGGGFRLLEQSDGEFVAGMIGQPWSGGQLAFNGADEFTAYAGPGDVKIAFNMMVQPDGPGWCKVSTETRILALGAAARTKFSRYWRLVYPGSALIRLMWLDAIERRLAVPGGAGQGTRISAAPAHAANSTAEPSAPSLSSSAV